MILVIELFVVIEYLNKVFILGDMCEMGKEVELVYLEIIWLIEVYLL